MESVHTGFLWKCVSENLVYRLDPSSADNREDVGSKFITIQAMHLWPVFGTLSYVCVSVCTVYVWMYVCVSVCGGACLLSESQLLDIKLASILVPHFSFSAERCRGKNAQV